MLNLDKYKNEIKDIISELKVDDYLIEFVPGEVMNNDKMVDVIYVLIEHKGSKKRSDYLYRTGNNLKQFLKDAVNDFEKKIVKDVLENKNSLLNSL